MNGQRVRALSILFVIIFACWWGVAVFTQKSGPLAAAQPAQPAQAVGPYAGPTPIVLHHSVKGVVHSYSGTLALPSACDSFSTGLSTRGTAPVHVTLTLLIVPPAQACAQAASSTATAPFEVSITSSSAPVLDGVIINNAMVPSTVVETP